ncbi:uncharacterized protein LOC144632600 [Oculina patagonica]
MSKSAGKKGEKWRKQVKFVPEAATDTGSTYTIKANSLIQDMWVLIDAREMILQIWVYKKPIFKWQLTQLFLNHQFVVLETDNWWWSIEKNGQEILIQRSKNLSWVRDYEQRELRITPIVEMSYDIGRKSMKDLIEFLYRKNELSTIYHWIDDNCKAFAKRLFNEFADTKYHGSVIGGYSLGLPIGKNGFRGCTYVKPTRMKPFTVNKP